MTPLADPVSVALLQRELRAQTPLLKLRGGKVCAYLLHGDNAPHLLREIGRVRELSFRAIGGGTGGALDLDPYDYGPCAYRQLILWAPQEQVVVGGCRVRSTGTDGPSARVATEDLFAFSERFRERYGDALLDIGRLFVHPAFQARAGSQGIFTLDSIWQALAAVAVADGVRAFFGRVVFPKDYHPQVRDLTLALLQKHFAGDAQWVHPRVPAPRVTSDEALDHLLVGKTWREDMRLLRQFARARGAQVPALLRAYLGLSDRLRVFGTAADPDLGGIEETCLLIDVADVLEHKAARYRRPKERSLDAA